MASSPKYKMEKVGNNTTSFVIDHLNPSSIKLNSKKGFHTRDSSSVSYSKFSRDDEEEKKSQQLNTPQFNNS